MSDVAESQQITLVVSRSPPLGYTGMCLASSIYLNKAFYDNIYNERKRERNVDPESKLGVDEGIKT